MGWRSDGNEDSFVVDETLFAVADGLGGYKGGEIASKLAVRILHLAARQKTLPMSGWLDDLLLPDHIRSFKPGTRSLYQTFREIDHAILERATQDLHLTGMATTLCAMQIHRGEEFGEPEEKPSQQPFDYLQPYDDLAENPTSASHNRSSKNHPSHNHPSPNPANPNHPSPNPTSQNPANPNHPGQNPSSQNPSAPYFSVANVGDSRLYRFSGNRLQQITEDHTVAQELIHEGRMTEHQAVQHESRHKLTQALGGFLSERGVDMWEMPVVAGDRFMLCSDGLVEGIDNRGITRILAKNKTAQTTAETLVKESCKKDGRDDTTTVIVDVVSERRPPRRQHG